MGSRSTVNGKFVVFLFFVPWIGAQLLDSKGVLCLDARNQIRFEIAGDGIEGLRR